MAPVLYGTITHTAPELTPWSDQAAVLMLLHGHIPTLLLSHTLTAYAHSVHQHMSLGTPLTKHMTQEPSSYAGQHSQNSTPTFTAHAAGQHTPTNPTETDHHTTPLASVPLQPCTKTSSYGKYVP